MSNLKLVTDNTNDLTFAELKIGDTINNGTATVVACTKRHDRVIGDNYASWVAICIKRPDDYHPYVVWNVIARPEGWSAQNGDYCTTLVSAVEYYTERGGK
jgi:hypothetical protein